MANRMLLSTAVDTVARCGTAMNHPGGRLGWAWPHQTCRALQGAFEPKRLESTSQFLLIQHDQWNNLTTLLQTRLTPRISTRFVAISPPVPSSDERHTILPSWASNKKSPCGKPNRGHPVGLENVWIVGGVLLDVTLCSYTALPLSRTAIRD